MKPNLIPWPVVLPLLSCATAAWLGYRTTLAEPDLARMAAALVYGGTTGLGLDAGFHYGRAFSFGYYALLYRLIPAAALRDPDRVALYMNYCGLAFSLLFAGGACLLLRRLLSPGAALFAAIVFLFSPVTMSLLASGHPMIAAAALLFWGGWLLLEAQRRAGRAAQALRAAAWLLLVAGLSMRSEIMLAFPFVAVACWAAAPGPDAPRWRAAAVAAALLVAACAAFLVLQRPHVANDGGAGGTLSRFLLQFIVPGKIARGVMVLVLALGLLTAALLGGGLVWRRRAVPRPLLLTLGALALPGLLFWLPNPQPARHFILPVLALAALAAALWAPRPRRLRTAALAGTLLALANQAAAELARPAIVASYRWPYPTQGRRATQQVPVGMVPLDQRANQATERRLRAEAAALAAAAPQQLIVLANFPYYMVAHLLAADPTLRMHSIRLAGFETLLLSNERRRLYLVNKLPAWPRDVLAGLLTALPPELRTLPLYEQPGTRSRYDKAALPAARAYRLAGAAPPLQASTQQP